jgi:hypothetical protein
VPWKRIDHDDRGPEFVFTDEAGYETMRAFFGGSSLPVINFGPVDAAREICVNVLLDPDDDCYAHFCNLEEHIERMQELAAATREWDQAAYAAKAAARD